MPKDKEPSCAKFNPELWESRTYEWADKPFIKDTIHQIFHIPLPGVMSRTIGRMSAKIQAVNAAPGINDFLLLSYDPSLWKSEFFMVVTQEVPGIKNVKISSAFETKVSDGPYHAVPQWIKERDEYITSKGQQAEKYHFNYTPCPKYAKLYSVGGKGGL